jgi:hypothetical protein
MWSLEDDVPRLTIEQPCACPAPGILVEGRDEPRHTQALTIEPRVEPEAGNTVYDWRVS